MAQRLETFSGNASAAGQNQDKCEPQSGGEPSVGHVLVALKLLGDRTAAEGAAFHSIGTTHAASSFSPTNSIIASLASSGCPDRFATGPMPNLQVPARQPGAQPQCYTRCMVETLTAVAAVVGAVDSLAAGAGVLVANGKLDRLTGRVDAVESTLQTLMVGLIGRSDTK